MFATDKSFLVFSRTEMFRGTSTSAVVFDSTTIGSSGSDGLAATATATAEEEEEDDEAGDLDFDLDLDPDLDPDLDRDFRVDAIL